MPWFIVVVAGVLEIVWALGLKSTQGFTRPGPTFITLVAVVSSVWLLAIATKTLPVGTAYAVWVGIGAVGTAVGGMLFSNESASTLKVVLLVTLIGSIVGLELTGRASAE